MAESPTEPRLEVGIYQIVEPPARLGFSWLITDPDGTLLCEAVHDLRLAQRPEGTELTLEIRILSAEPGSEPFVSGVEAGWTGTLQKLARFVEPGSDR